MISENWLDELVLAITSKYKDDGLFLDVAFTEVVKENGLSAEDVQLLLKKVKERRHLFLEEEELWGEYDDLLESAAIECKLEILEQQINRKQKTFNTLSKNNKAWTNGAKNQLKSDLAKLEEQKALLLKQKEKVTARLSDNKDKIDSAEEDRLW